ncbi:hypothetical protein BV25DRAFT_713705 [Artomyces pyxidatus]|uniref:Uncharacterized protein n=1 Tax=Artomyces pyxidatus TaxID=48021 RepID=A0ACB8T186_9AGAM|nr:hypothetical protein BV25DRAFT_713705 [Artomyces pyxidatus]
MDSCRRIGAYTYHPFNRYAPSFDPRTESGTQCRSLGPADSTAVHGGRRFWRAIVQVTLPYAVSVCTSFTFPRTWSIARECWHISASSSSLKTAELCVRIMMPFIRLPEDEHPDGIIHMSLLDLNCTARCWTSLRCLRSGREDDPYGFCTSCSAAHLRFNIRLEAPQVLLMSPSAGLRN